MQTLTTRKSGRRRVAALALAAGVVGAGFGASPAQATGGNPYERGPAPTAQSLTDARGPYQWTQRNISGARGFGGGQVFWPTSGPAGETYAAIALSPGFTAAWSSISWLGGRLAQEGFVVVGIETNTRLDQPQQRGQQLNAALRWAVENSPAKEKIDPNRLGVGGHSMGGGGTLEAIRANRQIKAGAPLAPWNLTKGWSDVQTPVVIVGGQSDVIAPVGSHSLPFFQSLRGPKKYLELRAASHFFPQFVNNSQQAAMISWYKRYLDNDTRYTQLISNRPGDASQFRVNGVS